LLKEFLMPIPELKWMRAEVQAPRGSRLRMLAAPAMDMTTMQFELPDVSSFRTPIEKVRLLLHTAQIEHAPLPQHLYATYSLKNVDESHNASNREL
jgi:hypothetical protein